MNKSTISANSANQSANSPLPGRQAGGLLRWTSKGLFAGAREIIIEHAGVEYRLRLTSQDKLILTK
jgi:hemin uptake protein HemP